MKRESQIPGARGGAFAMEISSPRPKSQAASDQLSAARLLTLPEVPRYLQVHEKPPSAELRPGASLVSGWGLDYASMLATYFGGWLASRREARC
jgi:hypothetical protein